MKSMTLHTDGGARGNPGPAGAGISLCDATTGEAVFEAGYWLDKMTNNQAEYTGLLKGIEAAISAAADEVAIYSDSELMVKQLNGEYRVKNANIKPLYEQAWQKLKLIPKWKIHHVRREDNRRADQLANMAMDMKEDVISTDEI
ncbi:MAG: ribonuclease HI family protein [Phycisphaerales bacterium]|nr:ribonuclease HI family protein [Phycisphaerales bacterium]MCB9856665.1 ribonuclease HI family protein [Phycisphaerales bacterium]MCB9862208.1 ribonuclease HI family protein [Phycisphaerales bacterium]